MTPGGWAIHLPLAPVLQGNIFHQSPEDGLRLRIQIRDSAVARTGVLCRNFPGGLGTEGPPHREQPLPLTSFLFVDEASRVTLIHHLDTSTLHCLLTWPSQSSGTMYLTSPSPSLRAGPKCGQRRSSCLHFCVCVYVCECLCMCVYLHREHFTLGLRYAGNKATGVVGYQSLCLSLSLLFFFDVSNTWLTK